MTNTAATVPVSGTILVDGAQLRYVVEGRGYPCLVVGSSTYYRRTFTQPLKETLCCAFTDHRGFTPAATIGAQKRYTLGMVADDVEQLRRALGWERVVVYGHSIHGLMALEYARQYPEHVSHVVMEGTPPHFGPGLRRARQAYWESAASAERKALWERSWLGIEERLKSLSERDAFVADYVATGPRLWADATFDSSRLWEGVDLNVELIGQLYALFEDYDVAARQPPVSSPIYLAIGRHDYQVPFPTWDKPKRSLVNLTPALFEQCGHTPHLEEPERFAAGLARWLRQH
jgi:proline iminopeptidase